MMDAVAIAPSTSTPEAFDVFGCELAGINLVEASAGTGKTWNICGLYLRLLLERKLDVQDILVVTFTNAATAELRTRVRTRMVEVLGYLQEAGAGHDPFIATLTATLESRGVTRADMATRLDHALQTFDEASILTIHGWCQRALGETPFAAGLPFAVDLQPDDTELRLAAVHDFWRRHIAGKHCTLELAAWLQCKKDTPDRYAKLLARHLAKPLARTIWPADLDTSSPIDGATLFASYQKARATWLATRDDALQAAEAALPHLNKTSYKPTSLRASAIRWDAFFRHDDPLAPMGKEDDIKKLSLLSHSCLKRLTNGGKYQFTPRHAFFDDIDAFLTARGSAEVELERIRLRLVRTLFDEAGPALATRKREARLASYDDLLHNLHAALTGEGGDVLARSLRERFPAALIDEFQDTDPVQFAIVKAIYGNGEVPLFLVGDPKQAIYGFRNADLHTYLQARSSVDAEYTLGENQRSTQGLIAAVNAIFSANGRAFMLDGLDYHPVRQGTKPREVLVDRTTGPHADLCVWAMPHWESGAALDRRAAFEASASATAGEVARLLRAAAAGEITLDDKPLEPGDIAVLVRTNKQGNDIKLALADLGVGSVELSQATVFGGADAEDVERVLAAILEPANARLMRAALATELLGRNSTQIAQMSADESLLLPFVERFVGYRDAWIASGVGVMYREMLTEEGVAARMLERPDGERRLTNLLHLGELLHSAAPAHRAPDALLRWLGAQRREGGRDEVAQLRLESDRNLVQIVTIHKVKGLEYPVVFCPFLWDGYKFSTYRGIEGCEYHDDEGGAVIDYRSAAEMATDGDIRGRISLEASAESLRLIYVALTRASHRCYLVAGTYGRLYYGRMLPRESTTSLLNWLVAGNGIDPDAWLKGGAREAEAIEDAWERLAGGPASGIVTVPLPMTPGVPLVQQRPAAESLSALKPPARIAEPWRISSFSGLANGAVSESAAVDHDAIDGKEVDEAVDAREIDGEGPRVSKPQNPPPPAVAVGTTLSFDFGDPGGAGAPAAKPEAPDNATPGTPPAIPSDDILRFPRGIAAGDCLHAALERIDFADPGGWDDAVGRALSAHPVALPGVPAAAQRPILRRMMARMVADVTRTPLVDGFQLDTLTPDRRLTELEFNLPAHRLSATALNTALKALGYPVDRLTFARLDGYLKGFIDLVFERDGRYFILDWKSNHLGTTPADYGPAALEIAMAHHGYHLQSLLYSVALTRYLKLRMPDYRHDRHFGGALYLFIRGVRPEWKRADGSPAGVHFHRPSQETLARLEALLAPEDTAVAR